MSYEYTDLNGNLLNISHDNFGPQDRVLIRHFATVNDAVVSARCIRPEDAPAVALAILEAAGMGPDSTEPTVREAARDLAVYVKSRTKRAEREAEDAKVSVYRLTSLVDEPVATWEQLGEDHKERWRRSYRNTRRFFEGS